MPTSTRSSRLGKFANSLDDNGNIKDVLVSANMTLQPGRVYRVMTSGITLTLPASPAAGDSIRIVDSGVLSSTSTALVARNGSTIMGLAEDLTLDTTGAGFAIWFNGTTWRLS